MGLGYITPSCWEVGFRYTNLNTADSASTTLGQQATVWATRSHPSRNIAATSASASASLDYHVFDLEIARWMDLNRSTAVRLFGGLRWLEAEQEFLVGYDGNDFDRGLVLDHRDDSGFAVRVGAEGHWLLGCRWKAFARGAGAVAYTNTNLQLLETNNAGSDLIVDISDTFTEPVTNLEAAVGLSWSAGSWDISGGYEMTHWLNLGGRTTYDDVHRGAYDSVSQDLLLDGMFLRVAYTR